MLKSLEWHDAYELHPYLIDPAVYPYVRYKAENLDEFLFITKQVMEKEIQGELITRVIMDEHAKPIGQITLFDIKEKEGYLGTWLGTPFHGKGYNQTAKETFFHELFYRLDIETIYMKIRKTNEKSRRAALKLPYAELVNYTKPHIYEMVNQNGDIYDVFDIKKEKYELYLPNQMEA